MKQVKYRIKPYHVECLDGGDIWYKVQKKVWFFWVTEELFYYREDAEEYLRTKKND